MRIGILSGLTARETFLMPPGQLFDLHDLYLQAHGHKRENDDYDDEEGDY